MQLEVTFRNLGPRDDIRSRASALWGKLEHFLDMAAEGQLIVAVEQHEAICELVVSTRGQTFKSIERSPDLRTAMDKVYHGIEEQLRRFKGRRTANKGRIRERVTGFVPADGEELAELDA